MTPLSRERGQATVEFALLLPLVALLALALAEAGLVVRDQVLVTHAAREAARAAAVGADPVVAAWAGSGLGDLVVTVSAVGGASGSRTVRIQRQEHGHLPLFGRVSAGLVLEATATMRFEGPP